DESLAALQQAWGIEGRPFGWSIDSCRPVPDGLHADVDLPETSTVALLDVALQVARLVDSSDPQLMIPVAAESVRLQTGLADGQARIEVRRRSSNDDGLTVDIAVKAPDGSTCLDIRSLRYAGMELPAEQAGSGAAAAKWDWSQVPVENMPDELEVRLRGMIARELGVPPAEVDVNQPFPELGLDSIMALAILREGKQLLGIDISATMFWDHPTISSLTSHLVELLALQQAQENESADGAVDALADSAGGVLDELFDSVESTSAGGAGGAF
ncbi:MAG: acyl carrier protein, partial [Mycobacterium sp.]